MLNKIDSFFKFEIFFFCVWAVLGVVKNQEQTWQNMQQCRTVALHRSGVATGWTGVHPIIPKL